MTILGDNAIFGHLSVGLMPQSCDMVTKNHSARNTGKDSAKARVIPAPPKSCSASKGKAVPAKPDFALGHPNGEFNLEHFATLCNV